MMHGDVLAEAYERQAQKERILSYISSREMHLRKSQEYLKKAKEIRQRCSRSGKVEYMQAMFWNGSLVEFR